MKYWGSLDCCKNEFDKYKFIFILSLADDDTLFAWPRGVLHPSPRMTIVDCYLWKGSKNWSSSGDDEIDIDGRVNLERSNVLDHRWWAHDVNNSLVDSHFISVPSVGSLTAWRLSRGNSQNLRWDSYWSSSFISLVLSSCDHLIAGLLQVLHSSSLELHSVQKKQDSERVHHNMALKWKQSRVTAWQHVPDSHDLLVVGHFFLVLLIVHI